jgi:hypothetical protein
MKIESYNRFKLVKKDIPEISKNIVILDANVGGVKLVYEVVSVKCAIFTLFEKQFILELPWIYTRGIERVFLRPYKELWSFERKNLPKSLWGKTNDPLTQLWVELQSDYEDIEKGMVILKKEIRDTNITKHLNKTEEIFHIKSKYNQFV